MQTRIPCHVSLLCAIAAMTAAVEPNKKSSVVEGSDFLLRSSTGKVLARLGMATHGPELQFFDKNGKIRISVGILSGDPTLQLCDENEKTRVVLIAKDDREEIALVDGENRARLRLRRGEDGPKLLLFDERWQRMELAVQEKETSFRLADPRGHPRVILTAQSAGSGLAFSDTKENLLLQLKAAEEDVGYSVFDASHQKRITLGFMRGSALLQLFDEKQRPVFSKP
jgi:hypothetical protein